MTEILTFSESTCLVFIAQIDTYGLMKPSPQKNNNSHEWKEHETETGTPFLNRIDIRADLSRTTMRTKMKHQDNSLKNYTKGRGEIINPYHV